MDKVGGAYKSFSRWSAGNSEPLLAGKVTSLELRRDGIPKREVDEYLNLGKSFVKKQIAKNSTLKDVEKAIKPIKNVKANVEFNLEVGSKTKLLLDGRLTCKKFWFQDLSPDLMQTVFTDVLNRGWDTVEKQSREMSNYNFVFPGLEFLTSSWAGGSFCSQLHVPREPVNRLLTVVAALTKGNLPELSSQVCSIRAF